MDYSLLVGLHFRDESTGDKIGLSPFMLRTGNLMPPESLCTLMNVLVHIPSL